MIDADISRHYSIEFIAEKIGIGKTKLKKGFREYFETGIFGYLRTQRMIKAVELLIHSDKPIKTIAKVSGFKYYSNFSSAFKRFHGLPPGKYRKLFSTK